MHKWFLLVFLLGHAQAASVSATSLFQAQGAKVELPPSFGAGGMEYMLFYPIRNAPTLHINTWLDYDASRSNRVPLFLFATYREFFSKAEQQVVNQLITTISTRCLNLLPERLPAIRVWLEAQNRKTKVDTTTRFGPMNLHFKRYYDAGPSEFVTEIELSRTGQPGVTPWNNYCTDAGRK